MDDSEWMYDSYQDHSDLSGILPNKGDATSDEEEIDDGQVGSSLSPHLDM